MIQSILELFERDLKRLEKQITLFSTEENIWKCTGSISNSSGHLTLHLCGNLRHFIGHVLGKSSYIRDRKREFESSPLSKDVLVSEISEATQGTLSALKKITPEKLSEPFPINVFGQEMTTEFFLFHLYGHFNYHLGQIDYLRRALEE